MEVVHAPQPTSFCFAQIDSRIARRDFLVLAPKTLKAALS
jgi:hypothetical protein